MKKTACEILLGIMAAILMTSAAEAAIVGTFGDYTVLDSMTGYSLWPFDIAHTNPAGFPAPVGASGAGSYPTPPDTLTIGTFRTYINTQSGKPDRFSLGLTASTSLTTRVTALDIVSGSITLAHAAGAFDIPANTTYWFDPGIDLSAYPSGDLIRFHYFVLTTPSYGDLKEMEVGEGVMPEPISMAFLGTGFVGMILSRIRKKKE